MIFNKDQIYWISFLSGRIAFSSPFSTSVQTQDRIPHTYIRYIHGISVSLAAGKSRRHGNTAMDAEASKGISATDFSSLLVSCRASFLFRELPIPIQQIFTPFCCRLYGNNFN